MLQVISRPKYIKLFELYVDTPPVKVLKGVRRCGKSVLLNLYIEELLKRGIAKKNIFHKRFDEFGLPLVQNSEDLQQEILLAIDKSNSNETFYIFLDEIQEVEGWERVVRGLHTRDKTDVFITGSNAFLLSSELATLLSGRYVEIDIYPLSFEEYLTFEKNQNSPEKSREEAFAEFMLYGGMPGLFSLRERTEETIGRELTGIYESIILNDVAKRLEVRDIALLERLVQYVFSTSGNLFSTRSIVNYLKSAGLSVSYGTIDEYLRALEKALILHGVIQAGVQGKEILRPQKKYYSVDMGLRNLSTGFARRDTGFQLENVVFLELLRRGYQVFVGSTERGEVDFIAKKNTEKIYIQVCESMIDPAVQKRELRPLEAIRDAYPKQVITANALDAGVFDSGISVSYIVEWLLDG